MSLIRFCAAALGLALASFAAPAAADDLRYGGKLLLTGGVSDLEGAGGGGLATWATITGYGAADGIGANLHATVATSQAYTLKSAGFAVGLFDRLELSYARQAFDTRDAGVALGLGRGFTFDQDVVGAKLRLSGDAVYGGSWAPQIAVGAQFKRNDQGAVVRSIGAKGDEGLDLYVAATKVLLAQSLVVDATVRLTKAN